uniref:Uncharacterized protein n=1 Tax=Meloidogyne enterolobii TaxID=390850 RepID=A0A6V7V9F8_MELEN|nr:unnamed protein product [Meloidogyne enterolobii]
MSILPAALENESQMSKLKNIKMKRRKKKKNKKRIINAQSCKN